MFVFTSSAQSILGRCPQMKECIYIYIYIYYSKFEKDQLLDLFAECPTYLIP